MEKTWVEISLKFLVMIIDTIYVYYYVNPGSKKPVTFFLVIIILYIGIEMCKKIIHFHRFLIRSLQMKSFVYFCAYPKIIADKPKLAPKRLLQNALEFCKINYFPLYLESSEGRTRIFIFLLNNKCK